MTKNYSIEKYKYNQLFDKENIRKNVRKYLTKNIRQIRIKPKIFYENYSSIKCSSKSIQIIFGKKFDNNVA